MASIADGGADGPPRILLVDTGIDAVVDGGKPDAAPADARIDAPTDPRPALFIMLSGYGHHATWIEQTWNTDALVSSGRAVVIGVDGSPDSHGSLSFNASHSCCDDTLANDDESRILAIATTRIAQGDVNPGMVWLGGRSNGGFMSIRLACDHPEVFAGAIAYAGAGPSANDQPCAPPSPVAILEVHGTADTTVDYASAGRIVHMPNEYVPDIGSGGTLDQLSAALDCSPSGETDGTHDVTSDVAGNETDVVSFSCGKGALEHWRVNGAGHASTFSASWIEDIWTWASAHGR